jgi:hypothetical protein
LGAGSTIGPTFTAVLQLLFTETTTVEWLFHQEKATLHELDQCTLIGEPL